MQGCNHQLMMLTTMLKVTIAQARVPLLNGAMRTQAYFNNSIPPSRSRLKLMATKLRGVPLLCLLVCAIHAWTSFTRQQETVVGYQAAKEWPERVASALHMVEVPGALLKAA